MARKESIVTIDGLKFRVRQMSATQLYDFIVRAILVLADSGLEVKEEMDINAAGAHILQNGLQALRGVEHAKIKPLIDELTACCTRISDSGVEQVCTPDIMDGFISDVRTIFKLQAEAVKVNFGFFGQGQESPSSTVEALNIGKPQTQKA